MPVVPETSGVLTRAEYRRLAIAASPAETEATEEQSAETQPAPAETASLAETVVADVAAAIVAETVGAQPDETTRRRLRSAARAVFETVADVPLVATHPTGEKTSESAFAASEPCHLDEFEFAARLFSFTGESPVLRAASAGDAVTAAADKPMAAAQHTATRGRRRSTGVAGRVAAASFSIGVMAVVGLLAVGTTTPAEALAAVSSDVTSTDISVVAAPAVAKDQIQAFVATGATGAETLDRPESYDVASMSDIAADSGVTKFAGTWVNDPEAAIQWPFPVGVPISAAYGSSSYLSQFSSPHRGVDLTPGAGAEIHVIADGVVRIATEAGGDYGVTVVVDHEIDGKLVSTRYGHMQHGSLQVTPGEKVTVGQVLGKVGQTGKATGPHLHFEVLLNGTTHTDPMAWMYAHTKD